MAHKPTYAQDISGCLESRIGPFGLPQKTLNNWSQKTKIILESLRQDFKNGAMPLLSICSETEDITTAEIALKKLLKEAETIIFFGTGGSALGGQTLAQMGGWNIPYDKNCVSPNAVRLRFFDNLDGRSIDSLLTNVDFLTSRFVVISKSGSTVETLTQAITTLSALKKAGLSERIPDLFLGITEPHTLDKKNGLRHLLEQHKIPILDHPIGIGGRFSCLTNVGLLPAMTRGLNPHLIRKGAYSIIEPILRNHVNEEEVPFAIGAALMAGLSKDRGIRNTVMMPYSDRLGKFSEWFVQLWAESLGKQGSGTCPIPALGPVDQHSQLQFFMDGPNEIVITIIQTDTKNSGPVIDLEMAESVNLNFLGNKTVGDIVYAQGQAVAAALIKAERPVRVISIPKLDEYSIGALLMHFMLETIITGRLLEVNPFDQPSVELAKMLTKQQLLQ
ncbi:MAG: glucose-6-phosphate isomerase [Hyphomicrobium sp.]